MRPELTKYIVFTYFSGDATAMQKQMIEHWLTNVRNVEIYFEWLEEWEKMQLQFQPDTLAALENVTEKLFQKQEPTDVELKSPTRRVSKKLLLLWAAASLIMMGFASYLGREFVMYRTYETSFGELNKFYLDDSSQVVLNANSTLKVPRWGFGKSTRHVYLEGEAEFSVQHTADHQYFKVHTADNSLITVLGTEFSVYTRPKQTNVVLNKGKVELSSYIGNNPLTMSPGDRATVESDGEIKIEKLSEKQLVQHAAWKEHRFIFDDTPLKEVAERIHEVFGVVVKINNMELASRTATGSFPAKNAEELLTSMSYMYSFEITKTENKIILIPNP
ncbi:FecR domain-containing protein [Dyadobacter sp. LHD-138]|uniref:FecR family protein n=1 Tax=Dyadobacter sp. LHD-138 TaxID=3071413 RepID=UPI0027E0543F|nr:FecR domain-containing protein [Dyadobacter sp. LHD-138]MDQ6480707.1 FecR domain-containing protein [Dyadobacter sp. LHD-138]